MGRGNVYRCTKCDYSFTASLGVGMVFPMVYSETVEKAKLGKLGRSLQRFLQDHPEGAIDCANYIIRCPKCGELRCGPGLDMYVPRKGQDPATEQQGIWSTAMPFEDESYVLPWDLEELYDLFARYPHRCGRCKGAAVIVGEEAFEHEIANGNVMCPCCGSPLESYGAFDWD